MDPDTVLEELITQHKSFSQAYLGHSPVHPIIRTSMLRQPNHVELMQRLSNTLSALTNLLSREANDPTTVPFTEWNDLVHGSEREVARIVGCAHPRENWPRPAREGFEFPCVLAYMRWRCSRSGIFVSMQAHAVQDAYVAVDSEVSNNPRVTARSMEWSRLRARVGAYGWRDVPYQTYVDIAGATDMLQMKCDFSDYARRARSIVLGDIYDLEGPAAQDKRTQTEETGEDG